MTGKTQWDRCKAPSKGQAEYPGKFPGLRLRVSASGRRTWVFRGRLWQPEGTGPLRYVTIGEYPHTSWETAKRKAARAHEQLREGIDPNLARQEQRIENARAQWTFGDLVTAFLDAKQKTLKPTTYSKWRWVLQTKFSSLHRRPLAAIRGVDLKAIIESVSVNSRTTIGSPVRAALLYAVEHEYLDRSPMAGIKIPKARGNQAPFVALEVDRPPDFSEMVRVLEAIDASEERLPASPWWNIYRVLALTGARPSAVIGLRWDDLELDERAPLWRLPSIRSKIGVDTEIPLCQAAAVLLGKMARGRSDTHQKGALVWPGRGGTPLAYPSREPLMVSLKADTSFKPGRFRDSLASWLEFQTEASEYAVCLLLNHKPPGDNTRRRHYAKVNATHQARVLIERWSSAVDMARNGQVADNVRAIGA